MLEHFMSGLFNLDLTPGAKRSWRSIQTSGVVTAGAVTIVPNVSLTCGLLLSAAILLKPPLSLRVRFPNDRSLADASGELDSESRFIQLARQVALPERALTSLRDKGFSTPGTFNVRLIVFLYPCKFRGCPLKVLSQRVQ
eukprot:6492117-Amphidinium_carterae.4